MPRALRSKSMQVYVDVYVRLGPRSIVRSVLSSGFEIHSLALTPRLKWGTTKVAGLAFDFGGVYRTCVPNLPAE